MPNWKRDIVQVTKEALGGGALAEAIVTDDAEARIVALVVHDEYLPLLLSVPALLSALSAILDVEDVPQARRIAQAAIRKSKGGK